MVRLLTTHYSLFTRRRGQAVLSLVFIIGALTVMAGVALAFVVVSFTNAGSGALAAYRARSVAFAGAHDALLILARNKDFSSASPYSVPLDGYAASVTVNQNTPSAGRATILSGATVLGRERREQVVVAIDQVTGEVNPVSWTELTL